MGGGLEVGGYMGVEGDGGGIAGVTMFIARTARCCNQHQCFTDLQQEISV